MHSAVDDVTISPDGEYAAAYSMIGDNHIRVWDMRTGELKQSTDRGLSTLKMPPRFSEDSRRCVFVFEEGADARIVLADAMSGRRLQEFKGHTALIASAELTADGTRLASGSFDKTVRVWDVETGRELFQASDPTASLSMRAAITPDGGRLLTYPGNGVWQVRSLTSGALLDTLPYETLNVDRDSRLVRRADGSVSFLTDRGVGEPLPVPEYATLTVLPGRRVAYTDENSRSLVVTDRKGTRTVIDAELAVGTCEWLVPNASGDRIIVVPRWQYGVGADIRIFDLERREGIATIRHAGKVLGVGFVGKSGECLLAIESTEGSDRVEIWSMAHPKAPRYVLKTASLMRTVAAFSPDGNWIAIGDGDNGAEVWRMGESRPVCRVEGHTGSFVNAVAFHPDSALLATAGADRTVRIWDVQTGKCLSIYSAHTAPITRLFWTRRSDGRDAGLTDAASIEASCADGTTRCWSASLSMLSGE
jgi:WD40 repeat protein